jgi:hypothetical protein
MPFLFAFWAGLLPQDAIDLKQPPGMAPEHRISVRACIAVEIRHRTYVASQGKGGPGPVLPFIARLTQSVSEL